MDRRTNTVVNGERQRSTGRLSYVRKLTDSIIQPCREPESGARPFYSAVGALGTHGLRATHSCSRRVKSPRVDNNELPCITRPFRPRCQVFGPTDGRCKRRSYARRESMDQFESASGSWRH